MPNDQPYVNFNKERLLCHMVLTDDIAPLLSDIAGPAYWRAFILQDRDSKIVYARFRYRYQKPDGSSESSWYKIEPQNQIGTSPESTVRHLRESLEKVLKTGMAIVGLSEQQINSSVVCFYPPADVDDAEQILAWMIEKDLIQVMTVNSKMD